MALKDMTCQEGCLQLLYSMNRLTVLRDACKEPPFYELHGLLACLVEGDTFMAASQYHAMCNALLQGGYRQVSGDLFRDFLLWMLLERENAFSIAAARGEWSEPLASAMRADLKLLDPFFELNSVLIKKWIGDRHKEMRTKPKQQKDNIAVLSSAVWAGGTIRPLPKPNTDSAVAAAPAAPISIQMDESEFPSWRYQLAEQEASLYVADIALEELYRRLQHAADRGMLLDDFWNFHATYGTGAFIRDRLFLLHMNGALKAMPTPMLPEEDAYTFYQSQRDAALHNAIRFMRSESSQNMLVTGDPGTGKTTQVFSLSRELPELRLIYCMPGCMRALIDLLPVFCAQPLKFAIFLDDFSFDDPHWPHFKAALAPAGIQPANILLIAAARKAENNFFPLHIQLPPPQLKDFIELVQLLLLREGRDVDFDGIQNACIDYAASIGNSNGSPLSFRSAEVIAQGLILND